MIELTNAYGNVNNTILFVDHNNLTVVDTSSIENCPGNCRVLDGRHNNGGWYVTETLEEIKAMIISANCPTA